MKFVGALRNGFQTRVNTTSTKMTHKVQRHHVKKDQQVGKSRLKKDAYKIKKYVH